MYQHSSCGIEGVIQMVTFSAGEVAWRLLCGRIAPLEQSEEEKN